MKPTWGISLCVAVLAVALTSCGSSPTFDAGKPEASMKAIADAMPEAEREQFAKDFVAFLFSRSLGKMTDPTVVPTAQRDLHGKTAIEMRAVFEAERARRASEEAAKGAENASRKAADQALLAKVTVALIKRTPPSKDKFSSAQFITVRLKNDTEHHLAVVRGEFLVLEEGRQVPWVKEDVIFGIPGGLKPGEEREIETTIDTFSLPDAAKPTSEVVRLKDIGGPDNKMLTRSYEWDR